MLCVYIKMKGYLAFAFLLVYIFGSCSGKRGQEPGVPGLEYALIPFNASAILKNFQLDSMFMKKCPKSTDQRFATVTDSLNKLRTCSNELRQNNKVEDCKFIKDYTKCASDVLERIADVCDVQDNDKMVVENEIKIYNAIGETMCADDGEIGKVVEEEGAKCVKDESKEIKKCGKGNAHQKYNEEGCKEAWKFTDCIYEAFDSCDGDLADGVRKAMKAGIRATNCKDHVPSSGTSMTAEILSIFFATFAARYLL